MANKLGLTNEIKELKLGKSFGKGENPSFHTFRYDFMPASVDTSKRATVDIGEGHQVMVTVPHIEGSGTANTVFKGSKKPYTKECVLIIDHVTGEVTLEKLSCNVQLKKTRAEGSSKIRSSTPVDNNYNSKKSPTPHKLSPHQKPFGRSSPNQKCSPLHKSPIRSHPSPNGNSNSSMPCLNTLSMCKPPAIPEVPSFPDEPVVAVAAPEVGVLSSSSSSESSSSGESSDSESDDHEAMETAPSIQSCPTIQGLCNVLAESPTKKEKLYSPSSTFSMPTAPSLSIKNNTSAATFPSMPTGPSLPIKNNTTSAATFPSMPTALLPSKNNTSAATFPSMPSANSLPSMPKFSQLSEDLKLSESDSDQSD